MSKRRLSSWAWVLAPCWVGCTLTSDFAVHQCESSSDCDILDGQIRRCAESQCIPGCESNRHCSDFDPRTPICPAPGAACVSLTSDEAGCVVSSTYDDATMGDRLGSDLTIVGAFAPTLSSSTWLTLGLAVDELNAASAASASALAPTVAVLCRGGDEAVLGAEHLVSRLHARGIVASLESVPLQALSEQPEPSVRALLLSPYATDAGSPPGDPWTWYLGGRYRDAVGLYRELIRALQASIEPRLAPARGLRIASLISEAREDVFLSDVVEDALMIDGRTTDYLFREDRFRRFRLSDDSPDERALLPAALAAYAPDLVLVFLGGEFRVPRGEPRLGLLAELEAQLNQNPAWSPFYVLGPRARGDDRPSQLAVESARFRTHVVGVGVDRAPDEPRRDALLARYGMGFPAAPAAGLFPADNLYDAVYHVAYATAVARTREPQVTLESMLDGFARITQPLADCVDVGPPGFDTAAERIAAGTPFQLCGVSGPARFSPDHARSGQVAVFCWTAAGAAPSVDTWAALPSSDELAGARCSALWQSLGEVP